MVLGEIKLMKKNPNMNAETLGAWESALADGLRLAWGLAPKGCYNCLTCWFPIILLLGFSQGGKQGAWDGDMTFDRASRINPKPVGSRDGRDGDVGSGNIPGEKGQSESG